MSDFSKISQIISPNRRILLSPLDWGLGHASRLIPLIRVLGERCQARITVAANGAQRALIAGSFPHLDYLSPPDYNIRYHKNRAATIAGLAFSLPHLRKAMRAEADWVNGVLLQHDFDCIISDNRYGFRHPSLPSFFITHQLAPRSPFGPLADRALQEYLYGKIGHFQEVWVPDLESAPGLAGALSHPRRLPRVPLRYIGPLSRLQAVPANGKTRLLVILSGPEPQRSILEKRVLQQWPGPAAGTLVLVRGLPEENAPFLTAGEDVRIHAHLGPEALSQEIANAQTVLCRSGYSSIMDLLPLHRDIVMVPTPGQTEQEYLARLHAAAGNIRRVVQGQLRLSELL